MKRSLTRPAAIFLALVAMALLVTSLQAFAQEGRPDSAENGITLETIRLSAGGRRFYLKIFKDSAGNIFLPLKDMDTGLLMSHFGCRATYLEPMKTVVLGFENRKDSRIVIGDRRGDFCGKPATMKAAPFISGGSPMLPMEALEYSWKVRTGYSEVTKTYYLDPVITDVSIVDVKGRLKLVATATGPLKWETSLLTEPRRFVIDVSGAVLEDGLENKDLPVGTMGSIFLSHQSRNPNVVRIVIPQDKGVEVEMVEQPAGRNVLEAWLFNPQVVAPVQDLKQERITDLLVGENKNSILFTVKTTGPVQYEWRRLLPPDNRYFVDIPNAIYTAPPFHKKLDSGYLDGIKVEQYKPLPQPVVRVTFDLHVPSRIELGPNPKYPEEIRIEVFPDTINPRGISRQGFGVTQHVVKGGLVICIDPGHGGGDPGACNRSMGLQEKEITLDISLRLAGMLRKAGWNVVMTRTTDRDVSYAGSSDSRELGDRVQIANQTNSHIFVSIHIDANTSSDANGSTTYYSRDDSQSLANHIQASLVQANGRRDWGVRNRSFFVIRHTKMPAVLVECAFISNPYEASLLATPQFRQQCANGIFNGLMSFARASGIQMQKAGPDESSGNAREAEEKRDAIDREINQSNPQGNQNYNER